MMNSFISNDLVLNVYLTFDNNLNNIKNMIYKCSKCKKIINNYITNESRNKFCSKCWINQSTYVLLKYK